MQPFRAIIFDLDGVIVDSEPLHERAFREVFAELGYGDAHGVHFPDYYGRSDLSLWLDFIQRHQPAHTLAELTGLKQSRYLEMVKRTEPLFNDLPELVEKLAACYPLAVASGSTHLAIEAVLALRQLRRRFRVVLSSDDVAQGKPAPDVFLRAAELMAVAPQDCCVIEDSAAGVAAARAAGMRVIAITNTLPAAKLANATWVVETYAEIERLLL